MGDRVKLLFLPFLEDSTQLNSAESEEEDGEEGLQLSLPLSLSLCLLPSLFHPTRRDRLLLLFEGRSSSDHLKVPSSPHE